MILCDSIIHDIDVILAFYVLILWI